MSRADDIEKVLSELQSGAGGVAACAVVADDGLVLASLLPPHVEPARLAGLLATLVGMSRRLSLELERGTMDRFLVGGALGYVAAVPVADGASLVALADREIAAEGLFSELKAAAVRLAPHVGARPGGGA